MCVDSGPFTKVVLDSGQVGVAFPVAVHHLALDPCKFVQLAWGPICRVQLRIYEKLLIFIASAGICTGFW